MVTFGDAAGGDVGQALGGVTLGVRTAERRVARTGTGRLLVRVEDGAAEYVIAPGRYESVAAGGWFETGDRVVLDERGVLRVTGRDVRRVNVGGRKIDPVEVERVIIASGLTQECAVVGLPNDGVTILAAFVVGEQVDELALRRYLAEHLSPYKWPGRIVRTKGLPRTRSGKVRRGLLTARRLPDLSHDGLSAIGDSADT
jgi:acyl-coenzyme A synthetase/AMP-(fatty) acid ligase